jgi:hypothetical protein
MTETTQLHTSPYTNRIVLLTGADHREALILETGLRWGFGNSGTLDHLDRREFDDQVRTVVKVFAMDHAEREESERLAELEHLVPSAPRAGEAPLEVGDRVRVWFTGNGVVVAATDDPNMRPVSIRLDGADDDSYYHANQVRPEVVAERRPVPSISDGGGRA